MTQREREQMNSLCLRIQDEKDYSMFVGLMRELGDLMERKELRFGRPSQREWRRSRPWKTVPAVVSKVLPSLSKEPGRVEISIPGADELFREIRIENTFTDVDGRSVALKQGEQLDITIEADAHETVPA
jgi:hypothetical protein